MGWGIVTSAQLALVAAISITLATNTDTQQRNTSPSLKARVVVAAPSKEDMAAEEETRRINKAMNVLTRQDAALYRTIFEAQKQNDWEKADRFLVKLTDKRLVGSVMADRFERRGASVEDIAAWLKVFAAQPEADALYAKAVAMGGKNLPRPRTADAWGTGGEMDSAANFTAELMVESTAPNSQTKRWAQKIQQAVRRGAPEKARDVLLAAQKSDQLAGTFAADAEAVIAESFFRSGERQQATALSNAAARANQPLGLWIRGLIAWENADYSNARALFSRLAEHPALNATNKSAAHFWAYRAESRCGSKTIAYRHLVEAADAPRSFYGLLATQLLGRNPAETMGGEAHPKWTEKERAILTAHPAGWRALALVQAGQIMKAEAELRRMNPAGNRMKQRAMLALADFVPMPALSLRLASLSGEQQGFDPTAYPLLPWQPSGGFVVDRALLFALARHESLFDPKAVSSRGASGLMQIMPATASHIVAKDARLSAMAEERKLSDPSFNMALGQKYVQDLARLPQIGNNLVMLLAAYNSGPSKVASWVRAKEPRDPLLFLESVPVRETRGYIARVLPHYWAYRVKLGRPTNALRELAEGKWPKAPLSEEKAVRMASLFE